MPDTALSIWPDAHLGFNLSQSPGVKKRDSLLSASLLLLLLFPYSILVTKCRKPRRPQKNLIHARCRRLYLARHGTSRYQPQPRVGIAKRDCLLSASPLLLLLFPSVLVTDSIGAHQSSIMVGVL